MTDEPASKRRLRLMPEVLPDPTKQHHAQGAPRTRTLEHMRRLMAMAATTAALGVACTKEGAPPIRKEDDSTAKKKSTPPDPTTAETATASATAVDTGTIGYGVVDPMPPPAKCAGLAASVAATATWKGKVVELKLPKTTRPDGKWSRKDPPTAYSGKITKTTWIGDDLVLEIVPDSGAPLVSVYVSASCAAGDEHVNVSVDVSKPGTAVITLYDAF